MVDEFSLVQAIDRLGQGVIVTVAPAAGRGFDACLGQTLAVADVDVLRTRSEWWINAPSLPD